MTDYQIVCKNLTSDQSKIEKVGLVESGKPTKLAQLAKTPKQINDMIGGNDKCFVTDEAGVEAEVIQFGDDFIRTKGDKTIKNNLLHLRDCNKFS